MKSHKNIFKQIVSFENLLLAAQRAQKSKRFKNEVLKFNYNLEANLLDLQNELISETYVPGEYRTFYINDPKHRKISAAPYKDRVIHHAICNILAPHWDRSMIYDSYACRKNKGTHLAIERFTKFARKNRYVLKCDISKFFDSIEHSILKYYLFGKIKEHKVMNLLNKIIDSTNSNQGLPIGNLTSQWFANIYLSEFDWFIKQELKCEYYIRYMDDFVFFSNSKQELSNILHIIKNYLAKINLSLKDNHCQIWQTAMGVNYLGFKIFPTHRVLLKRNIHRVKRRLGYFQKKYAENKISLDEIRQSLASWLGHVKWGDNYQLTKSLMEKYSFYRE